MKFLRRNSEVKDGCVHLNNPERAMFHPLGEVDQAALGERDPLVFEAELNYAAKRLGIVLVCSEKSEYLVGVIVGVMGRAVEGLVVSDALHIARAIDHVTVHECY